LRGGVFGAAAYWNDTVYYVSVGDVPKAFRLAGGLLSTSPVSQADTTFGYPGATPLISANGSVDGILWAVEMGSSQQLVLHAYDATDLSRELYNSSRAGERNLGQAVKFTPPLVANGKVYVGGVQQLTVFGVAPQAPTATPSATPTLGGCSAACDSRPCTGRCPDGSVAGGLCTALSVDRGCQCAPECSTPTASPTPSPTPAPPSSGSSGCTVVSAVDTSAVVPLALPLLLLLSSRHAARPRKSG